MYSNERIVFENAANLVRYYTWFVDPFVDPAINDTLLEKLWRNAADSLGLVVEMTGKAKTFVSDISHTLHDVFGLICLAEITPIQHTIPPCL